MEFDYLLITILAALSSAAILMIATLGLSIVFGLMGVINLAHGEFIMFGAYAALTYTKIGFPFFIAVVLATLTTALFGAIVEILIIKRLYGRLLDTMLATWGLSMVLYQAAVLIFGTVTPGIDLPQYNFSIGSYTISSYLLATIPIAILLMSCIYYILTHTKYGIMARAAIANPITALTIGIQTKRLNTITFALGTGLAGLAGAVLLPLIAATPNMGFTFAIKAFLTVVVAGPLALTGTAVASTFLGMTANITSNFYTSVIGDIVFFTVAILLLRFFPLGISAKWRGKL